MAPAPVWPLFLFACFTWKVFQQRLGNSVETEWAFYTLSRQNRSSKQEMPSSSLEPRARCPSTCERDWTRFYQSSFSYNSPSAVCALLNCFSSAGCITRSHSHWRAACCCSKLWVSVCVCVNGPLGMLTTYVLGARQKDLNCCLNVAVEKVLSRRG